MGTTVSEPLRLLWLEITGRCQLECGHCYASSGPDRDHGPMTTADWKSVIDQAAALGTRMVQFIGGEPTLRADLPGLIGHALDAGVRVEVYSNLVHVPPGLWETLARPGVGLATSFYTDDRTQHERITGRDTLRQTTTGILAALDRGIPLRVGLVDGVIPGQRTAQARAVLEDLGVPAGRIRADRMRRLGRPASGPGAVGELCGRCGHGVAAVLADGTVAPCVMSRWLNSGDVRDGLEAALHAIRPRTEEIVRSMAVRGNPCIPDQKPCKPEEGDGVDCRPAETPACDPKFCNPDHRR